MIFTMLMNLREKHQAKKKYIWEQKIKYNKEK